MPNSTKPQSILTESLTVKIHLSKTEIKGLKFIAKNYKCSLGQVAEAVLHRCMGAEIELIRPNTRLHDKWNSEFEAVLAAAEELGTTRKEAA